MSAAPGDSPPVDEMHRFRARIVVTGTRIVVVKTDAAAHATAFLARLDAAPSHLLAAQLYVAVRRDQLAKERRPEMTSAADQYEQIVLIVPVRVGTTPSWIVDLQRVADRSSAGPEAPPISIARVDYSDGAKRALAAKLTSDVEAIRDALIVFERNADDATDSESSAFAVLHQTIEILRQELAVLAAL